MRRTALACALLLLLLSCTGDGTGPEAPATARQTVYYFDDEALTPVFVQVGPGEGLDAVAQAVLEPPPEGFTTTLDGVEIRGTSAQGDTITVEVSESFADGSSGAVSARAAQVVFALTQPNDGRSVEFTIDSEPVELPGLGNGAAFTRADFEEFKPWLDIVTPLPGNEISTRHIEIEVLMREEIDLKIGLSASGTKYFDVVKWSSGVVTVPRGVGLIGGGTIKISAVQGGRERIVTFPVTFIP